MKNTNDSLIEDYVLLLNQQRLGYPVVFTCDGIFTMGVAISYDEYDEIHQKIREEERANLSLSENQEKEYHQYNEYFQRLKESKPLEYKSNRPTYIHLKEVTLFTPGRPTRLRLWRAQIKFISGFGFGFHVDFDAHREGS